MYPQDAASGAKFRKLGRKQFVLRYGVLGWGVPVAIFFSLLQGYLHGWQGFAFQLLPALILFPAGGIFYGQIMWWLLERKQNEAGNTRHE